MKLVKLIIVAALSTLLVEGALIAAVMCPHIEHFKNDEPVAIKTSEDFRCAYTATKGSAEPEHSIQCHYDRTTHTLTSHNENDRKLCPKTINA